MNDFGATNYMTSLDLLQPNYSSFLDNSKTIYAANSSQGTSNINLSHHTIDYILHVLKHNTSLLCVSQLTYLGYYIIYTTNVGFTNKLGD